MKKFILITLAVYMHTSSVMRITIDFNHRMLTIFSSLQPFLETLLLLPILEELVMYKNAQKFGK